MNTKLIGGYAVALCSTYFLNRGYQVLLPMVDAGHYDLVVEHDGVFQRIQCKYTTSTKGSQKYPVVGMCVSGGLKKDNGGIAKKINHRYASNDFDLLWVVTNDAAYLIPLSDALQGRDSKTLLRLYPRWDKYRVAIPVPYPTGEDVIKRASPRLTHSDKTLIKRLLKEGKSQDEVADIIGVSRSCISMLLHRDSET